MNSWLPIQALLAGITFASALAAEPATNSAPKDPAAIKNAKIPGLLQQALTLKAAKRHDAALALLQEAELLDPNNDSIHNVRGAIYADLRDFAKARESFLKAQIAQPGDYHAAFNLAEVDFVEGRYPDAEAGFERIHKTYSGLSAATLQLIQFKVIVCQLKQDKTLEAEARTSATGIPSETPAKCYAQAALALHRGDKEASEDWLGRARRDFKATEIEPYIDALMEVNWFRDRSTR